MPQDPETKRRKERERYRQKKGPDWVPPRERPHLRGVGLLKQSPTTLEEQVERMVYDARRRAEKANSPFEITYEWVLDRIKEQGWRCLLTDIEFTMEPHGESRCRPFVPSLDQIQPGSGYTHDNVRVICAAMNHALHDYSDALFARIARAFLEKLNAGGGLSGATA